MKWMNQRREAKALRSALMGHVGEAERDLWTAQCHMDAFRFINRHEDSFGPKDFRKKSREMLKSTEKALYSAEESLDRAQKFTTTPLGSRRKLSKAVNVYNSNRLRFSTLTLLLRSAREGSPDLELVYEQAGMA
jgi:hypothetical protein